MANVKIIGIVPENIIDVEYNISQSLRDNFENFINEAIKELEKLGVKSKKIASYTLDEIIKIYSNPTSQRDLKQFA